MSLNRTYSLFGTQPRIIAALGLPRPVLSDVIRTPLRLPFGATVTIEETITIRLSLVRPELVDVDLQWFAPKYYLGSWELIQDVPTPQGTVAEYPKPLDGAGFISSFNQQILFSKQYLVRGRRDGAPFPNGTVALDQCNFVLVPRPPSISPLLPPGFEPGIDEGVFKGDWSNEELGIDDATITSRAESLGIYVKPGVQLDSISHNLRMGSQINLSVPQSISFQCFLGSGCDTEFDTFVRSINSGEPIDTIPSSGGFGVFSSQGTCDAAPPGIGCTQFSFTCSNGDTRLYWIPASN